MLSFDFWVFLIVFSLGGHCLDTYRTVVNEHGAFELCLPSLGFFFTKLVLRTQLLGQRHRMTKVRVGPGHELSGTICRDHLVVVVFGRVFRMHDHWSVRFGAARW